MREYCEGYPVDVNDRYYQGEHPGPDRRNSSNFGFAGVKRNAVPGGNKAREDATDYLNERLKVMPYESTEVMFDQRVELPFVEGMPVGMLQMEAYLMRIGSTATVTFDGVAYECDVVNPMPETKAIGNFGLIGEGEDNGMPFCVMIMQGVVVICGQVGTHSLKIQSLAVKTIDDKYLPRMSFVVRIIDDGAGIYADRTFADMFKAYLSGKTVSLVNGGVVYSLVLCDESFMRFIGFNFSVGTSSANLTVNQVDITNDDAVTFISANFNGVKN